MKRVTVFLLLAALMCNVGFAEGVSFAEGKYPTADFKSHVITGGFWDSWGERSGGFGEIGIRLMEEDESHFVFRDCITLGGYGHDAYGKTDEFGELVIGNKVILGGMADCILFKVRGYSFFGTGISFWGSPDVDFASGAPLLELTFGGGFEFQYAASSAFVIEFGGRFENPAGKERKAFRAYTNSSPLLTIGCRTLL